MYYQYFTIPFRHLYTSVIVPVYFSYSFAHTAAAALLVLLLAVRAVQCYPPLQRLEKQHQSARRVYHICFCFVL